MSEHLPIVAATGSSGAGTTSVKSAFEHIFRIQGIEAAIIEGDSFHRYDRGEMESAVRKAQSTATTLTHFSPDANHLARLERLFQNYSKNGSGEYRHYAHTEEEARIHGVKPGEFTPWRPIQTGSDLLFYEGLHGGFIDDKINVAENVDLLIGVVPIINLEWIQKINRDRVVRGYSVQAATEKILSRMPDYVHFICPQFSRTDVNFQRIPTVDTSNPFTIDEIPTSKESLVVISVSNSAKIATNLSTITEEIEGAFLSRTNTIVVPGGRMAFAIELLLNPVIQKLMDKRASNRS